MTSNENLGQLKSCIAKHTLPKHLEGKDKNHLAAAFYQSKVWDPNSTIKIKFLALSIYGMDHLKKFQNFFRSRNLKQN